MSYLSLDDNADDFQSWRNREGDLTSTPSLDRTPDQGGPVFDRPTTPGPIAYDPGPFVYGTGGSSGGGGPFDEPRATTNMRAPDGPDDSQPRNDPPRPPDTPRGGSGSADPNEQAIRDQYQRILGRAPSAQELAEELDVARRYGLTNPTGPTGGALGRIAARGNNTPGSGVTGNPFAGWSHPNDPRTVGRGATPAAAATRPGGSAAGGGGSARGNAFANTSPLFSDPASALLENYALDQFGNRINPNPTSGTALYEKYARELMDTLRQPVYSPQDEAILKTKATNAIMQERDQTKQRWLEELQARGIPPSSGVALDGLQRIESHFEGLRTTAEAQFASDAIGQTRANRLQVLNTAGQLSQEEEARLQDAGNYARVPYDLQDRAFQRNLQLVGAGGSPSDLTSNALGIANFQNNSALSKAQLALQQQAYGSGNNQAMTAALLQYLGYLFA